MARMHTKKHGKAKSRKPMLDAATNESGLDKAEIEKLISDYAKQGMGPAQIGEKLKREHKVLYIRKATGQKLMQILKEKKLAGQIPPDMLDLMRRAVNMRAHLSTNKKDVHSIVRLGRVESKIWRMAKYYMREGVLPKGWRYDPQQAELLIRGKA
jgi:small subunit ribosomal protein S15